MRKAFTKLEIYLPLVLVLALCSSFMLAGHNTVNNVDLEAEAGAFEQAWTWDENSILNSVLPIFVADKAKEENGLLVIGRKANISKSLPNLEFSLLARGKVSELDLKDNFKNILSKNSKLKTPTLKQAKKSNANKKAKSRKNKADTKIYAKNKDEEKYSLFSAFSSWQPKTKKLSRIYKKVYKSGKLSKKAISDAFKYYEKHKSNKGLSDKYLVVADYTKVAKEKRMHLINLRNGKISSYHVAHGKRSGPVGGRVLATSNRLNSHMTSKGFFKVGYKEGRTIKKGYKYLSVTGLERANRKVGLPTRLGGRDVVIHTAAYVNKGGRSFGCFSIRPQDRKPIFSKIKGALFYSYTGNV